jgi:hypothetical protein
MKFAMSRSAFAFALGLLAFSSVQAAGADAGPVVRITSVGSPLLNLYARDAFDSKVRDVPRESVPVPLEVSDTAQDGAFLKVKIAGETVWVSRRQVNVKLAVSAGCLAQETATTDAGIIRGANRGCSK